MRKSRWLIWVRALIDVVALVAAVLLAYNYRFHVDRIPIPGTEPPAFGYYLAAAPLLGLIFVVTFAFSGVYRIRRGRSERLLRLGHGQTLCGASRFRGGRHRTYQDGPATRRQAQ